MVMAFLGGKKPMKGGGEQEIQRQRYTPEQQALLNQIIGGLSGEGGAVSGGLDFIKQLLGGQTAETAIAPMMRQFNEQTLPQLSERFAGADALNSSAFGQSLGSAGAGLQENLFAARNDQQMQGLQGLMAMLNPALTQQFDLEVKKKKGFGALGSTLGTILGGAIGGPAGASIGGSIGGSLGA